MKDVAAVAGVSLSTVSRVVNGNAVAPELAVKVERAVTHLSCHGHRRSAYIGYSPVLPPAIERLAG
jgi:DNA-binding LacI/PurR family transcriptional regulator